MRNKISFVILAIWIVALVFFSWPKGAVDVLGIVALVVLSMAAGISLYRLRVKE